MLFKVEQTPPRESGASLTRQWWTYDGDYSDRGDGAEYVAFFCCRTGVEKKILKRKNEKEAERVEARGGA